MVNELYTVKLTEKELLEFRPQITSPEARGIAEKTYSVQLTRSHLFASVFETAMGVKATSHDIPIVHFVAQAVVLAESAGLLVCQRAKMRECAVCGTHAGWVQYPRTTRYHEKGTNNYDKPRYLRGWELEYRFVHTVGYLGLGCCSECWDKVQPLLAQSLVTADVLAEIPEGITGIHPKFEYTYKATCTKCTWTGWKAQMGRELTILGGGHYYGRCPNCGEVSGLGNTISFDAEKWAVVDRETKEAVRTHEDITTWKITNQEGR